VTAWTDILVWQRLRESPDAQQAAEAVDPRDAAAITRLRKRFDAELVSAALELAEARRKAVRKFSRGAELWCDVAGIEQSSGETVAAWKATRVREVLGEGAPILDLCCGVGGDSMALAAAGLRVTAVDVEPRRAWMAGINAACAMEVADVGSISLAGAVLHADPARREERGGARSWSLDDHRPGREWIERAMRETQAAAIKFSPGVDRRELGAVPAEWEYIEHDGRLVQAVAWCGRFARSLGRTRATVLDQAVATVCGTPDAERADRLAVARTLDAGQWISEPSPSLERAQLLTEAAEGRAAEVERGLGLVVSSERLPAPWFEGFVVIEECVAREEAIRAVLERHGLAARSVRVRGRAADADALTRSLRARPDGGAVVFAFRRGERTRAVIARRC